MCNNFLLFFFVVFIGVICLEGICLPLIKYVNNGQLDSMSHTELVNYFRNAPILLHDAGSVRSTCDYITSQVYSEFGQSLLHKKHTLLSCERFSHRHKPQIDTCVLLVIHCNIQKPAVAFRCPFIQRKAIFLTILKSCLDPFHCPASNFFAIIQYLVSNSNVRLWDLTISSFTE